MCSSSILSPSSPSFPLPLSQEEEMKNHMNAGRRCAYLERKIKETEEEIGRQEKAKQGVESLRKVYQEQPDFTDDKGAEDVTRQLLEVGRASVRRVHVHTHTHTPSLLPSPSLPHMPPRKHDP